MGVDLSACGLRAVTSFGEPGAAIDATHATIEQRFGVEQIVDGYGLTEVWPLGGNCPQSRALHIPEDIVAVECIDPETGAPVGGGRAGRDRPHHAGRRHPSAAALPHARRRAADRRRAVRLRQHLRAHRAHRGAHRRHDLVPRRELLPLRGRGDRPPPGGALARVPHRPRRRPARAAGGDDPGRGRRTGSRARAREPARRARASIPRSRCWRPAPCRAPSRARPSGCSTEGVTRHEGRPVRRRHARARAALRRGQGDLRAPARDDRRQPVGHAGQDDVGPRALRQHAAPGVRHGAATASTCACCCRPSG